jgi:fatty acid desaturase
MMDKKEPTTDVDSRGVRNFLTSFFASLARDIFQLIVAFAVGTGAGAIACWYFGVPLIFSLLGGILVLGFALALTTDSWFS